MRNEQSTSPLEVVTALAVAVLLSAVVMMRVVEGGWVVDGHGLASFSTLQVKLQYAVKHQPAPSVLLYIKVPKFEKKRQYKIPGSVWNFCLFKSLK